MASDAPTPHSPPMPIPNNKPQDKEHGEVRSETAQQFDCGEEDDVRHQRTAASVAVGHHAKDQCAKRTHGQRAGNRQHDGALADMKMLRQDVEQEDHDEEVEGIERPAQKASRNGVPAIVTCAIRALGSS